MIKTPREILLAFYTAVFMCQFYKKSAYRSIIAYFMMVYMLKFYMDA